MKNILKVYLLLSCFALPLSGQAFNETEVCPGRGERCAYVKILGIKIWQKKTKGGPGVIVKPSTEDE